MNIYLVWDTTFCPERTRTLFDVFKTKQDAESFVADKKTRYGEILTWEIEERSVKTFEG